MLGAITQSFKGHVDALYRQGLQVITRLRAPLQVITLGRAEAAPAAAVLGCSSGGAGREERIGAKRRQWVIHQDLIQLVFLLKRGGEEVCEMGQRVGEGGAGVSATNVILRPADGGSGWHARCRSYPLEVVVVDILLVESWLLRLLGLGR